MLSVLGKDGLDSPSLLPLDERGDSIRVFIEVPILWVSCRGSWIMLGMAKFPISKGGVCV